MRLMAGKLHSRFYTLTMMCYEIHLAEDLLLDGDLG